LRFARFHSAILLSRRICRREIQPIKINFATFILSFGAISALILGCHKGSFGSSLNNSTIGGGEIVQIDNGYPASFTVGKDKIFLNGISKIYATEK
jgi:hypothetical protein